LLFSPDKIGLEYAGVHELLVNSIKKCDIELRKTLFSEIVLTGGNTLIEGFAEKLISEIKKIGPKDIKLKIYSPPERKHTCWLGGAILCNLDSFRRMWITKKDFEDQGERVILKKQL